MSFYQVIPLIGENHPILHLARFNELSDPISHWGDRVSIIVKNYTFPNWESFDMGPLARIDLLPQLLT